MGCELLWHSESGQRGRGDAADLRDCCQKHGSRHDCPGAPAHGCEGREREASIIWSGEHSPEFAEIRIPRGEADGDEDRWERHHQPEQGNASEQPAYPLTECRHCSVPPMVLTTRADASPVTVKSEMPMAPRNWGS